MFAATFEIAGSSRTNPQFARPALAPAANWPYAARVAEAPMSLEVVAAAMHAARLPILALCAKPKTIEQICGHLALEDSIVRHHVQVLVQADLLRAEPDGYRSGPGWPDVLALVEDIAERHAHTS